MPELTPHFAWAEVTRSATADAKGIDNRLPDALRPNVERMAAMMEEVRALLGGHPLTVNSWYRCWALNAAVGSGKRSMHPLGLAVDFEPTDGTTNAAAFRRLADSTLAFDQLIHERTKSGADWIHVGLAPDGMAPRREVLEAAGVALGGPMTFTRIAAG